MDRTEFAALVDHIEDWWGPSAAWSGAERLTDGFAPIEADAAYEIIRLRRSDPDLAKFPPRPAELAAAAQRLRADQGRVLPAACDHQYNGRWLLPENGECPRCRQAVSGVPPP